MQKRKSEILSVSQFNGLIKEVLSSLGIFRVKGEVTEFRVSPNKGLFLKLSDGQANLSVGGYAPTIKGLDLIQKDMDVVVEGVADLYTPYGTFSLSAHKIEAVGEGSLAIAYQKLKEKLESEGLFAAEHKQELPKYITKIALVTGKDSAAYSDFIKILKEHQAALEVVYSPALVQGAQSVKSILKALELAKIADVDAIVLTRGGGSLEDLKSFNDEELAQEIFTSPTPVIAGVGHERDESIADFVADIRASTPSQAAYYIINQNEEFLDSIQTHGDYIADYLKSLLGEIEQKTETQFYAIESALITSLEQTSSRVESLERILKSFDFRSVLKRGFAMIRKKGREANSIKDFKIGDTYQTLFYDGKITSTVEDVSKYLLAEKGKTKGNVPRQLKMLEEH